MDSGSGELKQVMEVVFEKLGAAVGWLVALGGGLWAIWKGTRFAAGRLRDFWNVLNGFVNSVQAFQAVNAEIKVIKAILEIHMELDRVPMWRADSQGNCIEANTAYLQLIDLTMEEARGSGWYNALHPDDRHNVLTQWLRAVADGTDFTLTYRLRSEMDTLRVTTRAKPVHVGNSVEFHGSTIVQSRKVKTSEE